MSRDFEEARLDVEEKTDKAVDAHTENAIERIALKMELHNLLDTFEDAIYKKVMDELTNSNQPDFLTHRIALRYGVDVSEVTDEFLERKMREGEAEIRKEFAEMANQRGAELRKATLEEIVEAKQKFQKLVNG